MTLRESMIFSVKGRLPDSFIFVFHIPDLIEYRIHFTFYVVNRHQIYIPALEKRKIEITQEKENLCY